MVLINSKNELEVESWKKDDIEIGTLATSESTKIKNLKKFNFFVSDTNNFFL